MNDLAMMIDNFIANNGIKKTWIAEQLGISQQLLNKRLKKKNFTIEDANIILEVLGYKVNYTIVQVKMSRKE